MMAWYDDGSTVGLANSGGSPLDPTTGNYVNNTPKLGPAGPADETDEEKLAKAEKPYDRIRGLAANFLNPAATLMENSGGNRASPMGIARGLLTGY